MWTATFYFKEIFFCKGFSIDGVGSILLYKLDDEPFLEHVSRNWREHWFLRHFIANCGGMGIECTKNQWLENTISTRTHSSK